MLLAACGTKYDVVAHGGGTLRLTVEPVDAAGITVDETYAGASLPELEAIRDGDSPGVGRAWLVESTDRSTGGITPHFNLYGRASVDAGDCTMDALGLLAGSEPPLQLILDAEDGGHTTYWQPLPVAQPLGSEGSLSAVVEFIP